VGFPSNDFGGQEPLPNPELADEVKNKYGVNFPMMAKSSVKSGEHQNPIYSWLQKSFGGDISWNFAAKFIVNADGIPVARFEKESWDDIEKYVTKLLETPKATHIDVKAE
jgi:glutathione peroxidase